jgi:phage tail sheath protein FI
MALTDREKFLWFANAGVTRGVIPNAKKTRVKLKEEHRDALHQGGINPIAQFRDVGVDIFGQRTTKQSETSPLTRINVRKLMNYAKRFINVVSRNLQFEQNDETVVSEFMKKVNPELARIQRERGLRKFEVTLSDKNTPETLDRRQLFFMISLVPTSSMEEVGVELVITPTGNSFSE